MKLSTIGVSAPAGNQAATARSDDRQKEKGFGSVLDEFEPGASEAATGSPPGAATAGTVTTAKTGSSARVIDLAALASRAADTGASAAQPASALTDVTAALDASLSKGALSEDGETPVGGKTNQKRSEEQTDTTSAADPTAALSAAVLPFLNPASPTPNGASPGGAAATTGSQAAPTGLPNDGSSVPHDVSALAAGATGAATIDGHIDPGSVNVESHLGFSRGLDAASSNTGAAAASTGTPNPAASEVAGLAGSQVAGPPGASRGAESARLKPTAGSAGSSGKPAASAPIPANEDAGSSTLATNASPAGDAQSGSADGRGSGRSDPEIAASSQVAAGPSDAVASGLPTASNLPPLIARVAEGVTALAATPATVLAAPPDATGQQIAPAKTMNLQLSPAGLGTLSIRLHVSGRALDVHLEASSGETAVLIDRDRSALTNALSGRDYQVQTLTVTSSDATMQGANHADRGTDSGSANANSSDQRGGGSTGDRTGQRGTSQDDGRSPRRSPDAAVVGDRGGGSSSLFV